MTKQAAEILGHELFPVDEDFSVFGGVQKIPVKGAVVQVDFRHVTRLNPAFYCRIRNYHLDIVVRPDDLD